MLGQGELPSFAVLVSAVRAHITVTSSVPKKRFFWEYNGSSILVNCYLAIISVFCPLFNAVLDEDLAEEPAYGSSSSAFQGGP